MARFSVRVNYKTLPLIMAIHFDKYVARSPPNGLLYFKADHPLLSAENLCAINCYSRQSIRFPPISSVYVSDQYEPFW